MTPERDGKNKTCLRMIGALDMAMAGAIIDQLEVEARKNTPSRLELACPSGDPYAALLVHDCIRRHADDIVIEVCGASAMAGVIVLMAAEPKNRTITPFAALRLEPLVGSLNGNTVHTFNPVPDGMELRGIELSHGGGDLNVLFRMAAQVADLIVERSDMLRENVEQAMTDGSWFPADACRQAGLVGSVTRYS